MLALSLWPGGHGLRTPQHGRKLIQTDVSPELCSKILKTYLSHSKSFIKASLPMRPLRYLPGLDFEKLFQACFHFVLAF